MDEIRHKVGQFTFYTSKTLPSVSHSYLIIAVTLKVWTKSQLCKLLWNPFCWNQNSKTLFSARNNEQVRLSRATLEFQVKVFLIFQLN